MDIKSYLSHHLLSKLWDFEFFFELGQLIFRGQRRGILNLASLTKVKLTMTFNFKSKKISVALIARSTILLLEYFYCF
jgi:hypothetical protein